MTYNFLAEQGGMDAMVEAVLRVRGIAAAKPLVTVGGVPALLTRAASAVAAGRVGFGLIVLSWPSVPARLCVGEAADDVAARVFGRALGARDIALGLGALRALQHQAAEPGTARAWVAAGALSDALDVVACLASWRRLPRTSRWPVVISAGAAALTGAAAALTAPSAPPGKTPNSGVAPGGCLPVPVARASMTGMVIFDWASS